MVISRISRKHSRIPLLSRVPPADIPYPPLHPSFASGSCHRGYTALSLWFSFHKQLKKNVDHNPSAGHCWCPGLHPLSTYSTHKGCCTEEPCNSLPWGWEQHKGWRFNIPGSSPQPGWSGMSECISSLLGTSLDSFKCVFYIFSQNASSRLNLQFLTW